MTETMTGYTGDWKGFIPLAGQQARVVFRIREEAGELKIRIDNLDGGEVDQAMQSVVLEGNQLRGTLMERAAGFEGRFEGNVLSGQVQIGEVAIPLTLVKDNPEFVRYETARLNEAGQAVREYAYRVPTQLDDGLETGVPEAERLDPAPLHALANAVLAEDYPQTHSILVARHGRLVLEEYFYGHERDRLHGIQSVTKSITSLLAGIAIERGEITGIDQPVYDFFPERKGSRWVHKRYDLTLWHVLTMTAALDWEEELPYTDPRNDNTAMNRSGDWIGYVLNRSMAGRPGEKYMYTSGLSILLGGILRNATGQHVDEYAGKYLFGPLGIREFTWFSAPDGTRHTGGGLALQARDLLKIGLMICQGGKWQGAQVVPAGWIAESTRQQTAPGDYGYGYQWHIRRFNKAGRTLEAVCGLGYGGQCLFVLPEVGLVVVFNGGLFTGNPKPFEKLEEYILPALID